VKIHSLSIGLFDHAVTCAVVKVQKAKGLGVRGFGLAALFNPVIIIVRDRDVNLYCIDDNGSAFLKIKQRRGDRLIGRFQYRLTRLVKRHIFVRETAHINFRRFIYQFSYALLRLPKSFAASLMGDMALKPFRKKSTGPETFSSILYDGLGPTISENFYFPYVRKLWRLDPDKLAVTLAERRVSGGSVGKILMKMLRLLPGLRSETAGRFYYPRKGFGQITQAMADKAVEQGAQFTFGADITRIERQGNTVTAVWTKDAAGGEARHESDMLMSTIPLTSIVRLMDPPPPPEVVEAAKAMRFRGMILLYLILETDQFTEYDAHYFPEISIPISRMSEPKNYNSATEPKGLTLLCAELPCDPDEKWWGMSDKELGEHFCTWLGALGLPVTVPVRRCETRRLHHAYPVYDLDYQAHFDTIDNWLLGLDGMLVFGRQGLFAHDNTHHAFAMSYGAVDSVDAEGKLDHEKWAAYRAEFATHVVED